MWKQILFFALLSIPLAAAEPPPDIPLLHDLLLVEAIDASQKKTELSLFFNHLLQGGYWNMPSARMGKEGEIGWGVASVPPYTIYSLRVQPFSHLELSGNYRVFRGIDDPLLSPHGYGDMTDKGANAKLALLLPEESEYLLPGIAIGLEDFIGTKGFQSRYIVCTQVIPFLKLELSLGYGKQRINGLFGGVSWYPDLFKVPLTLTAEYDATPYHKPNREPHPKGRKRSTWWNLGAKCRIKEFFDGSISWIRGRELAVSGSLFYPLGQATGFLPKVNAPLPYRAPNCRYPLDELCKSFSEQGFTLLQASTSTDLCGHSIARLLVRNEIWRTEQELQEQLNALLTWTIPDGIDWILVEIDGGGMPAKEYRYAARFLNLFGQKKITPYELSILTKTSSPSHTKRFFTPVFYRDRELFCWSLLPKSYLFFGSSSGKIKGALGVNVGSSGYLFNSWYYSLLFGQLLWSDLGSVKDVDKLNPSQLLNVRTDIVNYYKQTGITIDEAYLERSWSLQSGWFSRFAIGHFEEEYGGIAAEFLYAPAKKNFALGIEGAALRKRKLDDFGFTNRFRKFVKSKAVKIRRFGVTQYFANLWYTFQEPCVELHLQAGKFLADDWGVRTELTREYASGMRLFAWYTHTNGKDKVNGKRYHDKGVGISLPLDMLYTCPSKKRWHYDLSAWLRDVGVIAESGRPLYPRIKGY